MEDDALELVRGDYSLRARHYKRRCVACLGGFDSLHLGHQALIRQTLEIAQAAGKPSIVILFEPLPAEFFARDVGRVQTLRCRLNALREMGVRRVLCLRFNQRIAAMTAETFADKILVKKLLVSHVVVGEQFRFGYRRHGTEDTLQDLSKKYKFRVRVMPMVAVDGERISSTRIRDALARGDMNAVELYLGRPYVIDGRVGRGAGRGKHIGFPTANLIISPPPPLRGVFAADITMPDESVRRGVMNAGFVPTFGESQYKIEVHVPNFNGCLYQHRLRVRVLVKLRDERKFASLDELRAQLREDVNRAKRVPTE